jgi:UDP-2-acetamido-3-amino-2,3-dideoxy-glucuronate N-acetyltransferase
MSDSSGESGISAEAFVHESAIVDEGAAVGPGTKIWHFVHVEGSARIGARCVLGQNVYVGKGVPIGNGVRIQNNVSLYTGVEVEDDAFLGPSCVFTNVVNPRSFVERKDEFRKTVVGRGASIGANAVIVCGHDIGAYALVGAGAVVTRDVSAYALVVGNPARQMGWVCRCGVRLVDKDEAFECPECEREYRLVGNELSAVENA